VLRGGTLAEVSQTRISPATTAGEARSNLKSLLEASGSSFLILNNYTAQLVIKDRTDMPPHLAS
jgi:hypothetical protein